MLICDVRPGPAHGCITPFGKDSADIFPPKWASISAMLTDLAESIRHSTLFDDTFRATFTSDGLNWTVPPQ